MTEKEKMLMGGLYFSYGEELSQMRMDASEIVFNYNKTHPRALQERYDLIKTLFKKTGKNFQINPPLYCDYGVHISIGEDFFANYDCIFLDVNEIKIGDRVMFGPRVCLYTAGHPIDYKIRAELLEFGLPITIGDDVWIGGNTVINPGVTIGDRVIIGAGSIVTKDIESDTIAFGNPCKVFKRVTDVDQKTWEDLKKKHLSNEVYQVKQGK